MSRLVVPVLILFSGKFLQKNFVQVFYFFFISQSEKNPEIFQKIKKKKFLNVEIGKKFTKPNSKRQTKTREDL